MVMHRKEQLGSQVAELIHRPSLAELHNRVQKILEGILIDDEFSLLEEFSGIFRKVDLLVNFLLEFYYSDVAL